MIARTRRDALDFYPTPAPVTAVLRRYLEAESGIRSGEAFLDPSAGGGHLIRAMRKSDVFGEAEWHAIEIDPKHEEALEDVAENVTLADALRVSWPRANTVMNPPFRRLDEFYERAQHQSAAGNWVAVLTPVAWWNAEKRAAYRRPDVLLALGWRPVFRPQEGPAHKGSQDFAWSILAPQPKPRTEWIRVEKPREA